MNAQRCFLLIQTRAQVQRLEFARATAVNTGVKEFTTVEEMPQPVHFNTLTVPNVGEELDAFADDRRILLRVTGRRWQFKQSSSEADEAVIFLQTEIISEGKQTGPLGTELSPAQIRTST